MGKKGKDRAVIWSALGTRSSVMFDLDNDGDLDIVTNEFNSRIWQINVEKGNKIKIKHIIFHGNEVEKDPEKSAFENIKNDIFSKSC